MKKNGGKRPGAGRPKNTADVKSKKHTERILSTSLIDCSILPLDVMIEAMRFHYNEGNLGLAAGFAKDAAPYLHPRLASTELKGPNNQPLIPPDIQITFVKKKADAGTKPTDNAAGQTPAADSKRD